MFKSVQRGRTPQWFTNAETTFNITITAVNMSKSWINLNHITRSSAYTPVLARLSSPTNLQITVLANIPSGYEIDWEVIEGN